MWIELSLIFICFILTVAVPSPTESYVTRTISGSVNLFGVTFLNDELFVVRKYARQVEVYDSTTLTLERHLVIAGTEEQHDMTSSAKYGCLYILALFADSGSVFRAEVNGSTARQTQWSLRNALIVKSGGISATPDEENVIVTYSLTSLLQEYTTHGVFRRFISLKAPNWLPAA